MRAGEGGLEAGWRGLGRSGRDAGGRGGGGGGGGFGYAGAMELIFEIRDAEEGGFWARALVPGGADSLFTEAESWEELRENLREVVALHFADAAVRPRVLQMHYVRDELVPVEAA
jgi:hypothetical protein